jgi:transposase
MDVASPFPPPPDLPAMAGSHVCQWQSLVVQMAQSLARAEAKATELQVQVSEKDQTIEALKRQFSESKGEKMPQPEKALRKRGDIAAPTPEEIRKRRADGQKWKDELPVEDVVHVLPQALPVCDLCGTLPDHALPSEISYSIELAPARLVRQRHVRQQARCECGSCVVTAPPPPRVGDKVQYGPRLAASLITAKCLDAVAIERYAKQLARMGVPVSPNTLFDLFHRAAEMLVKLYALMLAEVQQSDIVHADETRIQALANSGPIPRTPEQAKAFAHTRRAWIWVFIAGSTVVYKYSPSRSGETPVEVLGGSKGTLVVDAYTGYNKVTTPAGRDRCGCNSHNRRGYFDALKSAPEMGRGLELVLDLYRVEHDAKALGVSGTAEHATMRRTRCPPIFAQLKEWCTEQQAAQLPESKSGKAVAYTLNQWDALTRYVGNPKIPIDNNISERMLRIIAQGRATYLFVGNDKCGQNLAMLMSYVHSAVAHGHNPEAYLADVLARILDHPVNRLAELLPRNWQDPSKLPPSPPLVTAAELTA